MGFRWVTIVDFITEEERKEIRMGSINYYDSSVMSCKISIRLFVDHWLPVNPPSQRGSRLSDEGYDVRKSGDAMKLKRFLETLNKESIGWKQFTSLKSCRLEENLKRKAEGFKKCWLVTFLIELSSKIFELIKKLSFCST